MNTDQNRWEAIEHGLRG